MGRKQSIKPVTFRLYPEGAFLFCEVNVWPTKKAMYDYLPLGRSHAASCGGREQYLIPPKGKGRMRKTGLFAEANFYKRCIGIEVVSHELTHAAFAFADRRKLALSETVNKEYEVDGGKTALDSDCVEERFCYALGQMCRQFTQKCYDLGLYQDVLTSKT